MTPHQAYLLLAGVALTGQLTAQDTVRFTPTVGYPTFAVREPVLRIKPNTVLISRTMFGAYYTEAGGAFPGEVGPVYVEGATTNDMLVVRILQVRPNTDLAAANVRPSFGGLSADNRVRMLNQNEETDYTDLDVVKEEVAAARRLYTRQGWQVIDVTRRSIEETAAAIMQLVQQHRDKSA